MQRKIIIASVALLALAALEFGLLGASAAGIAGLGSGGAGHARLGAVTSTPTATPTPSLADCISLDPNSPCAPTVTPVPTATAGGIPICLIVLPPPTEPCMAPSPCYVSPPSASPTCTPTPAPTPCDISPPQVSPPCGTPTPIPCLLSPPSASPPCPPPTPAPTPCGPFSPPVLSPPCAPPVTIELGAFPGEIFCDGSEETTIVVHLRNSFGNDVPDGTPVQFEIKSPYWLLNPINAATRFGRATTTARIGFPGLQPPSPVFVDVRSAPLEGQIAVFCRPGPAPTPVPTCPDSPPQLSGPGAISPPPCIVPTPTPACVPSPPPLSGPGSVSPPCATPVPTSTPQPVPVCPDSPPQLSSPGSISPPCVTATPPRAPTSTSTAVPTATATATPALPCGDVNGNGRVTVVDLLIETHAARRQRPNARYDLNGDGRVDELDVLIVGEQLGRRCRR